jgi:hypothetical protein
MNQQVITKRGDIYDTLEAIDRGSLTKELRMAMREGTLASINTMKKSKIILEITIDPDTKTEPLAMRVSGNVKLVKPASPRKAGIFYPTSGGDLSREHPHQRSIEDAGFADRPHPAQKPAHDPETGEILQEGGGTVTE